MFTSVRSICSEDALLHVDGQLVVADLDEVRVADFLEAPVLHLQLHDPRDHELLVLFQLFRGDDV